MERAQPETLFLANGYVIASGMLIRKLASD